MDNKAKARVAWQRSLEIVIYVSLVLIVTESCLRIHMNGQPNYSLGSTPSILAKTLSFRRLNELRPSFREQSWWKTRSRPTKRVLLLQMLFAKFSFVRATLREYVAIFID
jgi:hypothetical protein